MKYCTNCGNELVDDAYVCPKCGVLADTNYQVTGNGTQKADGFYWLPFVLGCIALFVLFSEVIRTRYMQYVFASFRGCGLLAVVTSIKYLKTEKKVFPILGLVFGCLYLLWDTIIIINQLS